MANDLEREGAATQSFAGLRETPADASQVTVSFVYQPADLEAGFKAFYAAHAHRGRVTWLLVFVTTLWTLAWGVFGLLLLPLYLALRRSAVNTQVRRLSREEPAFQEPVTLTFDEDGLEWRQPNAWAWVRWNRFRRVVETDQVFLLYPQQNAMYIVPKRALTPRDVVRLRELCRQNTRFQQLGRPGEVG